MAHMVNQVTVAEAQQCGSNSAPDMIGKASPDKTTAVRDSRMEEYSRILNGAHRQDMTVRRNMRLRAVRPHDRRFVDIASERSQPDQCRIQEALHMLRVLQVLPVPRAKPRRWTEQQILHLERWDGMVEESFVAEVMLESLQPEPTGRDLANLQGGFQVGIQFFPGNRSATERNMIADGKIVRVEGPAPAPPVIGGTPEVAQASACQVIGKPQVASSVRVIRTRWRGFQAPCFEEADAQTRVRQRPSQRDAGRPRTVNRDVVRQLPAVSTGIGNYQ